MKTNLAYLQSMSGGNKAMINEMIDIFIEQVEEISVELVDALQKNDHDSLSRLAHKAKASVSIMGMDNLALELKRLEINANKSLEPDSYSAIVYFFNAECKIAIEELKAVKNE